MAAIVPKVVKIIIAVAKNSVLNVPRSVGARLA